MSENENDGWVVTDPNCNQRYKVIEEDEIYLFEEDRLINPETGETEKYSSEMVYSDYTWFEIVDACETFGYYPEQVSQWIDMGEEIPLMLECLFELEN